MEGVARSSAAEARTERAFLEYHHVVPFAAGGTATVGNIQLRCRAHNAYEADLFFGCDRVRERRPSWGDESFRPGTSGLASST